MYGNNFDLLTLLLVVPLESLRIIYHCRDIWRLSIEKEVDPTRMVLITIAIWVTIEIGAVLVWISLFGRRMAFLGLIIGIVVASLIYRYFKKWLADRPGGGYEEMIEQIGRPNQEEKPDNDAKKNT